MKKVIVITFLISSLVGFSQNIVIPDGYERLQDNNQNLKEIVTLKMDIDNLNDYATIVKHKEACLYKIIIYLSSLNKQFETNYINEQGDDFCVILTELKTEKNILEFSYYLQGTAASNRNFKLKYDVKNKKIQIINYNTNSRLSNGHIEKSCNLLTGEYIITKSTYSNRYNDKIEVTKGKRKLKNYYLNDMNRSFLSQLDQIVREYDYNSVVSFNLNNGKKVILSRTNEYFLQYSVLNKKGEIEFTFPTDDKTSTTNYFVFDDLKDNDYQHTLSFKNKDALYEIHEDSSNEEIGITVFINNKTYNLKGDYESLNGSLKIFKADYHREISTRFVNIEYQSYIGFPSLKSYLKYRKSNATEPFFNSYQIDLIYSFYEQALYATSVPKSHIDIEKFNLLIHNFITGINAYDIEKTMQTFHTKFAFSELELYSPKIEDALNKLRGDKSNSIVITDFKSVEFVKVEYSEKYGWQRVIAFFKYKLNDGTYEYFDIPLAIELLPNGDFRYCFINGWG